MDIDTVVVHCVSGSEVRDLMEFLSEQMYVSVSSKVAVTKDFCSQLFQINYVNRGFRLSVNNKKYYGSLPIDGYIKQGYPIVTLSEFISAMGNNDDLYKSDYSIDYLFL